MLTCLVLADTSTLRVPVQYAWESLYFYGSNPANTPFHMTPYAGGSFQLLGVNPTEFYWVRPTVASGAATFEIDATVSLNHPHAITPM